MTNDGDSGRGSETATTGIAFGRGVDWAIGLVLALVGILTALGGYLVTTTIDRARVSTAIRNGDFQSDVLTEAQAIEIFSALAEWGGLGLVATGAVFVVVAIGVVIHHGRARKRGGPTPRWILGVVGAIVGTLLGFVPLSPVIGGAVAGYLDRPGSSGFGTGIVTGILTMVPVLVWMGVAGAGLFTTLDGELAGLITVFGGIMAVFSLVYFIGLSALGGYVGGKLR